MASEEHIQTLLSALPDSPGVYQFYDKEDKLLYVGKAKSLKKRVSSYFQKDRHVSGKTSIMVRKVATHLIMGLGETEEELVELARKIIKAGASISLFAFTPVEGTPLENNAPPEPKRYRMVQIALALIRKNRNASLHYQNGKLVFEVLPKQLLKPKDFQNPGCRGCNRPYYNEKPGGFMYNYPNPPDLDDALSILLEEK